MKIMSHYQDTKPALSNGTVLGDISRYSEVQIRVRRAGTGYYADVVTPAGAKHCYYLHFTGEAPTRQYAVDLCVIFIRKNNPNCNYEVLDWS